MFTLRYFFITTALLACFLPFSHFGGVFAPTHLVGLAMAYLLIAVFAVNLAINRTAITVPRTIFFLAPLPLASFFMIWALHGQSFSVVAPYISFALTFALVCICISSSCFDSWINKDFLNRVNSIVLVLTVSVILLSFEPLWPVGKVVNFLGFQFSMPFPEGRFAQPNLYATAIAGVFALSIFLVKVTADRVSLVYMVVWAVMVGQILLTGSRVGILSILMSVSWMLVLTRSRDDLRFAVRVLVALCVGGGLYLLLRDLVDARSVAERVVSLATVKDTATSDRISLLHGSFLIGGDSPLFGHGFGVFRYLYADLYTEGSITKFPYAAGYIHPHNEIANLWVMGGLVGLFGVLTPICVLIYKACRHQPLSFVVFIPIALHSNTEYPVYASGFHLLLAFLALLVVFPREERRDENDTISIPSKASFLVAPICLGFAAILFQATYVSHMAGRNVSDWQGSHSYESYLQSREGHVELEHWLYGEKARLIHGQNLAKIAMGTGRADEVRKLLPALKAGVREFNHKGNWALLAAAYNGLGMRAHLIGFVEYISALDASYAQELREYYRLPRSQ